MVHHLGSERAATRWWKEYIKLEIHVLQEHWVSGEQTRRSLSAASPGRSSAFVDEVAPEQGSAGEIIRQDWGDVVQNTAFLQR